MEEDNEKFLANSNSVLANKEGKQSRSSSVCSRGSFKHTVTKVDFENLQRSSSGNIEFKTECYRWVMLLTFSGMIFNIAYLTVGFSSYLVEVRTAFGVQKWPIVVFIVMPTFLYLPMNFVAAWAFAKFKIHRVLQFAALLQLVGAWFRVISLFGSNDMFWPMLIGSFIFFLASPFVLNAISIIGNLWFADDERARSTAISGLMAPLGSLVGFATCGVIATGVDSDDPVDCLERLRKMVWWQNGFFTVFCILFIICAREKPKTPPSKIAMTFRQLS